MIKPTAARAVRGRRLRGARATPPARSSSAVRTPTAGSPAARSSSTPTAAWPATAAARSAARTRPRSTGRPRTRCATWPRTWWPPGSPRRCEVQVAYAIGVAHPVSVMVETFGTSEIDPQKLPDLRAGALRPAPGRDHRAARPAPADLPATPRPTGTSVAATATSPGSAPTQPPTSELQRRRSRKRASRVSEQVRNARVVGSSPTFPPSIARSTTRCPTRSRATCGSAPSCGSRSTAGVCGAGCSTPTWSRPRSTRTPARRARGRVGGPAARRRRPVPVGGVAVGGTARHVPARGVAGQRRARRRRRPSSRPRCTRRRSSTDAGRARASWPPTREHGAIASRWSRPKGRRSCSTRTSAARPRRWSPRSSDAGARGGDACGPSSPAAELTRGVGPCARGRVRRRRRPHRGVGAGARPRRGRRGRRGRRSARRRARAHVERARRRARARRARRARRSACVTPAPTVDAVVALGEEPAADTARAVAPRRGRRPARRGTRPRRC